MNSNETKTSSKIQCWRRCLKKRLLDIKCSIIIFWGTATVAVVLGQLYVGTGYRVLHGSMQELINKVDGVLLRSEDPFRGAL